MRSASRIRVPNALRGRAKRRRGSGAQLRREIVEVASLDVDRCVRLQIRLAIGSEFHRPRHERGSQADAFGRAQIAEMRGVYHQWDLNGNSTWKLPLVARVFAEGRFTGKDSTPYGRGDNVHDFMHAKITVADDHVFTGSYNLSHSGEENAENVLEVDDAGLANEAAAFVDEIRALYPAAPIP